MRRLAFTLYVVSCMHGAAALDSDLFMTKSVRPFHAAGLGVPSVIKDISSITGIIIGLEADVIFGKESRIQFDFPGRTVEDLARRCATLIDQGTWKVLLD